LIDRHLADSVIYELHAKGFTKLHDRVPEHLRGTYAGLTTPAAIDYLKDLGISHVELMPVMEFALAGLVVRMDIMTDDKYNDIFSVEEANRMVRAGVPFREAYRVVAGKAGWGSFRFPDPADYSHTGSIGNVGQELIEKRLDEIMKGFRQGYSPQELLSRIMGSEGPLELSRRTTF
jgi:glycogen operon protein